MTDDEAKTLDQNVKRFRVLPVPIKPVFQETKACFLFQTVQDLKQPTSTEWTTNVFKGFLQSGGNSGFYTECRNSEVTREFTFPDQAKSFSEFISSKQLIFSSDMPSEYALQIARHWAPAFSILKHFDSQAKVYQEQLLDAWKQCIARYKEKLRNEASKGLTPLRSLLHHDSFSDHHETAIFLKYGTPSCEFCHLACVESIISFPCKHQYHSECVNKQTTDGHFICPQCKNLARYSIPFPPPVKCLDNDQIRRGVEEIQRERNKFFQTAIKEMEKTGVQTVMEILSFIKEKLPVQSAKHSLLTFILQKQFFLNSMVLQDLIDGSIEKILTDHLQEYQNSKTCPSMDPTFADTIWKTFRSDVQIKLKENFRHQLEAVKALKNPGTLQVILSAFLHPTTKKLTVRSESPKTIVTFNLRKADTGLTFIPTSKVCFGKTGQLLLLATPPTGTVFAVLTCTDDERGQDNKEITLLCLSERQQTINFMCGGPKIQKILFKMSATAFLEECNLLITCKKEDHGDSIGFMTFSETNHLEPPKFKSTDNLKLSPSIHVSSIFPFFVPPKEIFAIIRLSSEELVLYSVSKKMLYDCTLDLKKMNVGKSSDVKILITKPPMLLLIYHAKSWKIKVYTINYLADLKKDFQYLSDHELPTTLGSHTEFSLLTVNKESYLVAISTDREPPSVHMFLLKVTLTDSFYECLSDSDVSTVSVPPANKIVQHLTDALIKFPLISSLRKSPQSVLLFYSGVKLTPTLANYVKASHEREQIVVTSDYKDIDQLSDISIKTDPIALGDWLTTIICLVPLQVARVSFNAFKALDDGSNITAQALQMSAVTTGITAEEISPTITFGMYDSILLGNKRPVIVICCMGQQSTGKSTLLNRIGGTFFDTSGARCTDGIWMSIRITPRNLLVFLDFEGLGSFERTKDQDVWLAIVGAALGNISIIRVGCYYDEFTKLMLTRLGHGARKMGFNMIDRFFGGELFVNPKDITSQSESEVTCEFKKVIESIKEFTRFLEKGKKKGTVFGVFDNFTIWPTPQIATLDYQRNIDELFNHISKLSPKYPAGCDFRLDLQMILSKIAIQDWSLCDQVNAKRAVRYAKDTLSDAVNAGCQKKGDIETVKDGGFSMQWIQESVHVSGPLKASIVDSRSVVDLDRIEVKLFSLTPSIVAHLGKLSTQSSSKRTFSVKTEEDTSTVLTIQSLPDIGLHFGVTTLLSKFIHTTELIQQFELMLLKEYAAQWEEVIPFSICPGEWAVTFQSFLAALVKRRAIKVTSWLESMLNPYLNEDPEIPKIMCEAQVMLEGLKSKWTLCPNAQCCDCFSPCSLFQQHSSQKHDCLHSHKCRLPCDFCIGELPPCGGKTAHQGKHKCEKQRHECGAKCDLAPFLNCNGVCTAEPGHHGKNHLCCTPVDKHQCGKKCSSSKCPNWCTWPYNTHHTQHLCSKKATCPYQCNLCPSMCSSTDHFHVESNPNCIHLCPNSHSCKAKCTEKGRCAIPTARFKKVETYVSKLAERMEYECSYTESHEEKKECTISIPAGKLVHDGRHSCQCKPHFCQTKCACCRYFCSQPYGHTTEPHGCMHGNMRYTKVCCSDKVFRTAQHSFAIGDSGVVYVCPEGCRQQGRGHFHLIPCECSHLGEHSSGLSQMEHAVSLRRHQTATYSHSEKYDECTCTYFWEEFLKFSRDHFTVEEMKVFELCPARCASEEHKGLHLEPSHCQLPMWHPPFLRGHMSQGFPNLTLGSVSEDGHVFSCRHQRNINAHTFMVLDKSGSMSTDDAVPKTDWLLAVPHFRNRLGTLLEAADNYVNLRLRYSPSDCVTIIFFDSNAKSVCSNSPVSKTLVRDTCSRVVPGGSTNFTTALTCARQLVESSKSTLLQPIVILFSDGFDNSDSLGFVQQWVSSTAKAPVINTIGFGTECNTEFLQSIAAAGKGTHYKTLERVELISAFEGIAENPVCGAFVPLSE
eukprot:TRINITY_DN6118_c0_g1_i3.p1 TRINITY_DN6118_c0_g1~~TRINITY_DN6118_c0_g1_i3.p1  ORF type:complete len:1949 (+),score=173.31 TRINITY_DN6118_c0_g1_i3:435-6281(+)